MMCMCEKEDVLCVVRAFSPVRSIKHGGEVSDLDEQVCLVIVHLVTNILCILVTCGRSG